jgi:hypothetical protein
VIATKVRAFVDMAFAENLSSGVALPTAPVSVWLGCQYCGAAQFFSGWAVNVTDVHAKITEIASKRTTPLSFTDGLLFATTVVRPRFASAYRRLSPLDPLGRVP